jgi:hypothetical protein
MPWVSVGKPCTAAAVFAIHKTNLASNKAPARTSICFTCLFSQSHRHFKPSVRHEPKNLTDAECNPASSTAASLQSHLAVLHPEHWFIFPPTSSTSLNRSQQQQPGALQHSLLGNTAHTAAPNSCSCCARLGCTAVLEAATTVAPHNTSAPASPAAPAAAYAIKLLLLLLLLCAALAPSQAL